MKNIHKTDQIISTHSNKFLNQILCNLKQFFHCPLYKHFVHLAIYILIWLHLFWRGFLIKKLKQKSSLLRARKSHKEHFLFTHSWLVFIGQPSSKYFSFLACLMFSSKRVQCFRITIDHVLLMLQFHTKYFIPKIFY